MRLCQEVFAILILWQARLSKRKVTVLAADNTSAFSHVFPLEAWAVQGFVPTIIFHSSLLSWFKVRLAEYSPPLPPPHPPPFYSPFWEWEILYCMRFHKGDLCSPGRSCRSVQGGITIFSLCVWKCRVREEGEGMPEGMGRCNNLQQLDSQYFSQGHKGTSINISKTYDDILYWILCSCYEAGQRTYKSVSVIGHQHWSHSHLAFKDKVLYFCVVAALCEIYIHSSLCATVSQ